MSEYYIQKKGKDRVIGPLSFSTLKRNVKDNRIDEDDLISEDGEHWEEAIDIPGLFEEDEPPPRKSNPKLKSVGKKKKGLSQRTKRTKRKRRSEDEYDDYDDGYDEPKRDKAAFAYWEQRPETAKKSQLEGFKISWQTALKCVAMIIGAFVLYHYVIKEGIFDVETESEKAAKKKALVAQERAKRRAERDRKREEARQERLNKSKDSDKNDDKESGKEKEGKTEQTTQKENKEGQIKNIEGLSKLSNLVYQGELEKAEELLKTGIDPSRAEDEDGTLPLTWAIEQEFPKMVELLIKHRVNVNYTLDSDKNTPLLKAVMKNNSDIASLLVQAGAKVNTMNDNGDTALDWAVQHQNSSIEKVLRGAKGSSFKELMKVIRLGGFEKAKRVISDAPQFVKMANDENETALHNAVFCIKKDVRLKMVSLLIDAGATISHKNNDGVTPLHFAVENMDIAVVKKLISSGAKANISDLDEKTPLSMLIDTNDAKLIEVANELKKGGANVNHQNSLKQNLVYLAAAEGNATFLGWLLKNGGKAGQKDIEGKSPLEKAKENNHSACVKLLN